ncbi:dynein intermediate chain 2, ciliary [Schistocerca serialis cubense]|uniref:dynein intermediate chain 2, ciliary n=1 Tax=Schistocerca serialis cubense TaxID=2023355 RepID=UPI00214E4429|nr:dynein intermediate chain 2, ciliary [Schistocerca serialis cubense]
MRSAAGKKTVQAASPKTQSKLIKVQSGSAIGTAKRTDQAGGANGDDGECTRVKLCARPDDQLDLSEQEQKEDITRVLTAVTSKVPDNVVQFSFKERSFVPVPPPEPTIFLLSIEGTCLAKDSEDARYQILAEGGTIDDGASARTREKEAGESGEKAPEGEEAGQEGEQEAGETEPEGEGEGDDRKDSVVEAPVPMKPKKITNQFNFCERASLTFNNPFRDVDTQTIPPPRAKFSEQVTQWVIYDAYHEDFLTQQREKDKDKKEKPATSGAMKKEETKKKEVQVLDVNSRMLMAVKILERMVNQNTFDEIAQDFRYWEDPSDEYRDEEGTLLPLWKFAYEKTKKNHVTGLSWNPHYYDLFAVSFGCFDFMKPQPEGAVCLFTLKNPSFPEYVCTTDTGVVCVDIHPKFACLIVVGLFDGNVAVYNVISPSKEPVSKSNSISSKHGGIVWQVRWGEDMPDGEMNFFSVSADGHVFSWVLGQSGLSQTVVIPLVLAKEPIPGPQGTSTSLTGCGTAIAFHPKEPLIFLVGSEDGQIYKCSTAYSSLFLATYEAHHMAVYKIDFNKYCPDIFASCSADWRVKIWEDNRSDPLFVFDLGSPVGDVEWAPYSSTVLAAVTNDGKVHVFDLNVNKYKPICVQPVVSAKKNKLTRLSFNYKLPVLIVGDDRGCITSLKLSPNLRKKVKPPKKGPQYEPRELEIMKLEKLLALVREPQTQKPCTNIVEPKEG